MRLTFEDRFWAKVDKPFCEAGCWNWTGNRSQSGTGYGSISKDGRLVPAHRASWEMHNGPIPPGMFVLHSCDNKACVNPAHLFVGNNKENLIDASRKKLLGRNQRLTPDAVAAIRQMRKEGRTSREIAAAYGISEGHARKAAVGSTAWAHVPDGVQKNFRRGGK